MEFTPSDPMNIEAQMESMAEELRKDIEDTIKMVLEYTSKLQQSFGEYWTIWKNLWQKCRESTKNTAKAANQLLKIMNYDLVNMN